ncbi:MAG: 30S ribosomal protein S18 [Firmicutes bacterium]|nr:30S ribosomal protein S18 [Bacillota bacterium]
MSEEIQQTQTNEDRPFVKKAPRPKKRPCPFCMSKSVYIDYKDGRLTKYATEKGKIISRRQTGLCAKHQRELTVAVKRARNMALI